jgi:endonuclease/exonuclease/phosphatase family metal-dependent hydrolase
VKQILFLGVLFAQALLAQFCVADGEAIRAMTFNIRFSTAADGENSWPNRRELLLDVVREANPQILGMQEALRDQLDLILEKFPHYSAVGVGREQDGAGEYSPLVYDRTRFDVLESETFWLSNTPTVRASKSWGNEITRICTWARLLDRTSNQVIRVYNTHWDHVSQPARLKSGELIAKRLRIAAKNEPLIVMGDFNVDTNNPAREPLAEAGLRDSFAEVHPQQANEGTFHAFTGKSNSGKIDAILVSQQWQVLDAAIIKSERDGRFPSDHFPVTATLQLNDSP